MRLIPVSLLLIAVGVSAAEPVVLSLGSFVRNYLLPVARGRPAGR